MPETRLSVSLTEMPQFRRLVQFLEDVETLATSDGFDLEASEVLDDLRELVDDARADLVTDTL